MKQLPAGTLLFWCRLPEVSRPLHRHATISGGRREKSAPSASAPCRSACRIRREPARQRGCHRLRPGCCRRSDRRPGSKHPTIAMWRAPHLDQSKPRCLWETRPTRRSTNRCAADTSCRNMYEAAPQARQLQTECVRTDTRRCIACSPVAPSNIATGSSARATWLSLSPSISAKNKKPGANAGLSADEASWKVFRKLDQALND